MKPLRYTWARDSHDDNYLVIDTHTHLIVARTKTMEWAQELAIQKNTAEIQEAEGDKINLIERERSLEALRHTRQCIERGWCQFVMARQDDGTPTPEYDPKATQWCLLGALLRVEPDYDIRKIICRALYAATGTTDLVEWNDVPSRIQKDVLRALDHAKDILERANAESSQSS